MRFWSLIYRDNRGHPADSLEADTEPDTADWRSLSSSLSPAATNLRKISSNILSVSWRREEERPRAKEQSCRRWLILSLLGAELEMFVTWQSPLEVEGRLLERVVRRREEVRLRTREDQWRDYARACWDISPSLTVFLPARVSCPPCLTQEVARLVQSEPSQVSHLSQALQYFLTEEMVERDSPDLPHLLTWARCSPLRALSLLCKRTLPSHPITAQYATRVLNSYPAEAVIFYIPQLVQAVRYDDLGYVQEFIRNISERSNLVAHQLLWNLETNMYVDEEGEERDPVMYDKLLPVRRNIESQFSPKALAFYEREFKFVSEVTNISGLIKPYQKGKPRLEACLRALESVRLEGGCYLPSNPEALVVEIDRTSGVPKQSAAKAPYLAKFKVKNVGISRLEKIGCDYKQGGETEAESDGSYWQAVIFKVGDDCRQDILALQVIQLCKNIFEAAGLDLYLFPYKVVATKPGCGVIECVPASKSRDQLGKQTDSDLHSYFVKKFGEENTGGYKTARRNFTISLAAYSVLQYLLQIKDRHNGNIMLDEEGHIIHIDFGFMFESSPGGNIGFEPDMKLTQEFVNIMGGKMEAPQFKWFMELCVKAYMVIRPYTNSLIYLVQLMLDTGLPCFRGKN